MQWIPRLELVETVAHIDPANIPLKPRPPYQLVCDPGDQELRPAVSVRAVTSSPSDHSARIFSSRIKPAAARC
ncbi:hypothetical protein I553_8349 [Mycobacterium xenopi 4042]|uniref:Uncharacterized protein n=1 Tax=Mycobacterium xenopi 4042 TaxID=1299334 RepID=X8BLS2_MYCXE|nr:hypothetical protein I553_8349 [Mycobacterium xenopi 4042]